MSRTAPIIDSCLPKQFAEFEAAGKFLETVTYAGNRYGTLKEEVDRVLASNRHVLLDIEVHGAISVRGVYERPRLVEIFVLPPSIDVLLQRLRHRRSESEGALAERLMVGRMELKEIQREIALHDVWL